METGKTPHNRFTQDEIKYVVRFLINYAQKNAILLPERIPGISPPRYNCYHLVVVNEGCGQFTTQRLRIWVYELLVDHTSTNYGSSYCPI